MVVLLSSCKTVVVPSSDPSPPALDMIIEYGPGTDNTLEVNSSSLPSTIQTNENEISISIITTDNNGGIKKVELWTTFAFYKNGQVQPGQNGRPADQFLSTRNIGDKVLKTRLLSHTINMPDKLGTHDEMRIEVWANSENFHGGAVSTPLISIEYPR